MSIIYWLLGLKDVGSIETVTAWEWYVGAPLALLAVVGVVALGIVAAGLNVVTRSPLPIHTRALLILLRLAGFAILLAMLCQLELRMNMNRNVRPKVAVVTDASVSMGLNDVKTTWKHCRQSLIWFNTIATGNCIRAIWARNHRA